MEKAFILRTYTKQELALMYFPDSNPHTAVNHMMACIRRCLPRWRQLQSMEYHNKCKSFTPCEVRAIVEYLREE